MEKCQYDEVAEISRAGNCSCVSQADTLEYAAGKKVDP